MKKLPPSVATSTHVRPDDHATLIYPKSRGTLRPASAARLAAPLIDPAYLTEKADADLLLEGIKLVREVMANRLIAGGITGGLPRAPTTPMTPRWPSIT